MRIDDEGWLVEEDGEPAVRRYPTVRRYPLVVPAPLGIVWHWTAGRGGPGFGEALARRAQTYRRRIDRAASWHVLIAKDGGIHQSAPFTVGTWHVGRPGVIAGRRFENINRATLGCELENAGRLRKIGDRFYCWPYWSNPGAPAHERRPDPRCALDSARAIAVHGEGTFDDFPAAQVTSAARVLGALVARFGWSRDACAYGHVDFDWPRKEDPGPLWKRERLPGVLDNVFGGGSVASAAPAPCAAQGG
jgi:N-acetyl-anhydromuramyl-L-alanine amidase AmpD